MFLDGAGLGELQPALMVVDVGLHFIPFAAAFRTPMFLTLGIVMALVGLAGKWLGWQWDGRAASGAAVIAGIVMLTVMAADAWQGRELRQQFLLRASKQLGGLRMRYTFSSGTGQCTVAVLVCVYERFDA